MAEHQPKILLLSLTDNALTNGPISGLAKAGCQCAVMSPPGFTCAQSRFVTRHFALPRHRGLWLGLLGVRPALERARRDWRPDLVVPLDDVAGWMLRGLAVGRSVSADLRALLERSLGAPTGYAAACSRVQLLDLARRIGVRAPRSRGADRTNVLEAAAAVGYPVALKLEYSSAGFGVSMVEDPGQLRAAIVATGFGRWRSLTHFWSLLRRSKEAVRRMVFGFIGLATAARTDFEVQQLVRGTGAMRIVAAWQGRVLDAVSFERLQIHPDPCGNTTVMRFVEHPEMEASARDLVAALGYSGIAHFDFMIEAESGHAYVIEMNARAPASTHLGRRFGHDLCAAIATRLGGSPTRPETSTPKDPVVVRFPRELERDPESAWLHAGSTAFHDVPWDDPPIFDFYLRRLLKRRPDHAASIMSLLGIAVPPQPDATRTRSHSAPGRA